MIRNAALLSIVLLKTMPFGTLAVRSQKEEVNDIWYIFNKNKIFMLILSSSQNKLISFMPWGCCIFYLKIKFGHF